MWTAGVDTDLDGDGELDAVGLDLDADGLIDDALADLDADGTADHAVLDLDVNGIPERHFTDDGTGRWSIGADRGGAALRWFGLEGVEHPASSDSADLDGDGAAERLADVDGNGLADRAFGTGQAWADTDGDGRWDVRLADADGDGGADTAEYL